MKKQRNNLIRPQPSLGETIAGKATEEGIRGFFGWLSNRGNKKELTEVFKHIERIYKTLQAISSEQDNQNNRLKEIEEKLK